MAEGASLVDAGPLVSAGSLAEAKAVVRSGVGEQFCPSSKRRFQTHCEMICQHSCPQGVCEHHRSGSCSRSSSAHTVSKDPRCRYRSSRSLAVTAGASTVLIKSSYTRPLRCCPTLGGSSVAGWVAMIKRTHGCPGNRWIDGQSYRSRVAPLSGWVQRTDGGRESTASTSGRPSRA